jgi:hypothetical protein
MPTKILETLRRLHAELANAGLDFAHRVAFEALRYASFLHGVGVDSTDEALDFIAMAKLLPKTHGSRQRLESTLVKLEAWAAGPNSETPLRPLATAKLKRMRQTLLDAQFVTFAE